MAWYAKIRLVTTAARWHCAVALAVASSAVTSTAAEPPPAGSEVARDATEVDPAEAMFPGCAAIKTDAEYPRLLKRAAELVADQRPDLAAVIWQKVIDEAG